MSITAEEVAALVVRALTKKQQIDGLWSLASIAQWCEISERKARELATLTGGTLTGVIDAALEQRLAEERSKRRKPTLAEMIEATEEFRRKAGLDKAKLNITKADFDALYDYLDDEIAGGRK